MFTPSSEKYIQQAKRLAASCEKYQIPYCIYQVSHIHTSISLKGSNDLSFTKANFISFNLNRFPDKGILYLDSDYLFTEYPQTIKDISAQNYDFAVYNWLNDPHNEAYVPVNLKIDPADRQSDFYRFSHHIGFSDTAQLIVTGGVQYYGNTSKAKYLLEMWFSVIAQAPGAADDECLDLAFNNYIFRKEQMKYYWLDKAYLRIAWWPHIKPVILHPELARAGEKRTVSPEQNGMKRCYLEFCKKKSSPFSFPIDYLIETKHSILIKIEGEKIVDTKPINQQFWIYPEDYLLSTYGV